MAYITRSSAPRVHPNALDEELVVYIVKTKLELNRSNFIVWLTLQNENIEVSFSSVRRIVRRYKLQNVRLYGKKYWAKNNPRRPLANAPGELVEVDTVYLMNHFGGQNLYITNVIDVYTRMTHSRVDYAYSQTSTAQTVLEAQKIFNFKFKMVQCDNGREFGERFKLILNKNDIQIRHTRVRRPNDNAHIERFNRTSQEEFIDPSITLLFQDIGQFNNKLADWLLYYNTKRPHFAHRDNNNLQIPPLKAYINMLNLNLEKSNMLWTHTTTGRIAQKMIK